MKGEAQREEKEKEKESASLQQVTQAGPRLSLPKLQASLHIEERQLQQTASSRHWAAERFVAHHQAAVEGPVYKIWLDL